MSLKGVAGVLFTITVTASIVSAVQVEFYIMVLRKTRLWPLVQLQPQNRFCLIQIGDGSCYKGFLIE